ncbi:hypothetical protein [Amycolatopsis sp. NPDC098790]|uniref:hypothetical protein n=1 Tax=Amycolatopsis sp. NPDC098790 TaxID=3363939 RepID=UPI003827F718
MLTKVVSRRLLLTLALAGAASACGMPQHSRGDQPPPPEPMAPSPPITTSASASAPAPTALLVGFCGAPGSTALGAMTGDLDAAGRKLQETIGTYPPGHTIVPVVELIATTAHRSPGADGMYRSRCSDDTVRNYLDAARRIDGVLLLNIQPGRADFLPEVQAYERWLTEPDVGVALDPEWAVDPGIVPGEEFGSTTGAELDGVAAYLSALVDAHRLPDKVMAYHQVSASVVHDERSLSPHSGVSAIKVVDGIGPASAKHATWRKLTSGMPDQVRTGFKLFFDEDTRNGSVLMNPADVLALDPAPSYIVYE